MKIRKYIICFVTVCTLLVQPLSFAEEKGGLTYEEARRIAISSNDHLRKAQNEIDRARNQRNSVSDSFPDEMKTSAPYLSTMVQSSQDLETFTKNKKLEYDSVLDAIDLELQKIFFTIKVHEESMQLADRKIQNLREGVNLELQKKQYGMASEFSVKKLQNDLEKTIREKAVSQKEVNSQYFALNKLLGQATVKYRKIQPITLKYRETTEKESENKIGWALSNSVSINMQKAHIASLELQKELYLFNREAASLTGSPSPEKPEKISDTIAVVNDDLMIQKRNLEEQIRNIHNNLKSIESSVKTLETQKKLLEERIRVAQAQLKAGMITAKQVDDIQLQLDILSHNLLDLKSKHSLLQLQFEKPHLIP